MKNRMKYWVLAATLPLALTSCDDFLDKDPDNRVYLDNPEFIEKLLVSAYPEADFAFCEAMSDNSGDRGLSAIMNDPDIEQPYLWRTASETYQGTSTNYWNNAYAAIAAANHALEAVDKFEVEGRGEEVRAARGEALLCRAYAHFMLANLFCMPYNPATADTELGIPYATEPETTLNPLYHRGTLQETYDKIEADLLEGLGSLPASYAKAPAYHFTRKAAYVFASRFYLWKGGDDNFRKSLEYANKVLGDVHTDNPANLLRQMNDPNSDYMGDYYDAQTIFTSSAEPANLLLVACISNMSYQPYWRYGMTAGIRQSVYLNGIFGYPWAYKTNGGYDYLIHRPIWRSYFQQISLNANIGYYVAVIPLVTMEEALFNRAESNALLGNYEEALIDMNTFLSKRLDLNGWNGTPVTPRDVMLYYGKNTDNLDWKQNMKLNPHFRDFTEIENGNQDTCYAYVNALLAMRRAEYLGTGFRWFDIRRYDIPIVHTSVTHPTDSLKVGDRRRAIQIPDQSQAGGIEPNPVDTERIPESIKTAAMFSGFASWN
ncbi:MAG: RagB/SusD family nutrient uptake outer membrane protein [Bacteroidaceae bacterium]|nr:RagB/SusD family nutrient uptake outer membrane protein [Bacteroidaceae bacterium]